MISAGIVGGGWEPAGVPIRHSGIEACTGLVGFTAADIAKDFVLRDNDADGIIEPGGVYFKGEASDEAYRCYRQLESIANGLQAVRSRAAKQATPSSVAPAEGHTPAYENGKSRGQAGPRFLTGEEKGI